MKKKITDTLPANKAVLKKNKIIMEKNKVILQENKKILQESKIKKEKPKASNPAYLFTDFIFDSLFYL